MSLPRLAKPFLTAVAATTVLTTAACSSDSTDDASTTSDESDASTDGSGSGAISGEYEDGTYEASGSYSNPSGTSAVTVELTLMDNLVTDVEVTPEASGTSLQFQKQFVSGIAEEVVGRDIDELDVDKVAGSSLTSGGFNAALDEIKADASA